MQEVCDVRACRSMSRRLMGRHAEAAVTGGARRSGELELAPPSSLGSLGRMGLTLRSP